MATAKEVIVLDQIIMFGALRNTKFRSHDMIGKTVKRRGINMGKAKYLQDKLGRDRNAGETITIHLMEEGENLYGRLGLLIFVPWLASKVKKAHPMQPQNRRVHIKIQ